MPVHDDAPLTFSSAASPRSKAGLNSEPLIQIDHVTFGYDASRVILNDVTMQFARGKVTAILGGSGCGKTTRCCG